MDASETADYISEFNGINPVPNASAPQPQFTVYPYGGTFVDGVKITLFCNISYAATSNQVAMAWEHNGTALEPSATVEHNNGTFVDQQGNTVQYSMLIIHHFSQSSQGDYVCRVGNGNYTIVSPGATLKLPSKWIV